MENLKNNSRKRIQQEKKKKINDVLHDSKVIKHQALIQPEVTLLSL
jgi:hypothetical protein